MDIEQKPEMAFYVGHVEAYEREAKTWESRSKKIIKRYRDQRGEGKPVSRFNILWSNVQTLHPALYDGTPTPNVDRRFEDDEEVNTTVAQILERSVSYFVKTNDFDDCMNQAVLDRLLSGRGTCWVRYVPNFKDVQVIGDIEARGEGVQVTDDMVTGDEMPDQELYSEDVVLDYVHWQDFGHNVCRTWQENRMVWRKVFLSKKEIKARFPDTCMVNGQFAVPLDAKALGKSNDDKSEASSKGTIIELWDRVTKKVYWFNSAMEDFLDVQDDPLQLSGFYPCPKPVYATIANDSLIPTPDFFLYQDQAQELDMLTVRIEMLTRALKVVGVYDASAAGVQRMLSENSDNTLIPVERWAVLAEKGGLKGVVDFFPINMVADVLVRLYESRNTIKQDIYEITGISDIVRGQTNANETATAQQIKGKFATLRLDNMQKDVSRFSRDCVRIMTEVIAEHFSIDTLKEVSGVRLLTQAEKQQAMMSQQPAIDQMGNQVPPKPLPEHIEKLMKKPTWEEIEAVLRENGARCFRIDIETDSTIKADQDAEKAARTEFLNAAGGFIQQAAQIQSPEMQPLLMEMLEFGVKGFKVGRELETQFKVAKDALLQKVENPAPPPPDPAVEAAKAQMELKKQESAQTMELKRMESAEAMALKKQESAENIRLKEIELAAKDKLEHRKVTLDARTKAPELAMADDTMQEEGQLSPITMMMQQMAAQEERTNQVMLALGEMQAQNTQEIIAAVTRPKKVEIKDATGRITKTAEVG